MKRLYISISLYIVWILTLWIIGLHIVDALIAGLDLHVGPAIGLTYAFSTVWVILIVGVGLLIFGNR